MRAESKAIAWLREHRALERWTGGYWTWPRCPPGGRDSAGRQTPFEYVGAITVNRLVDRGFAVLMWSIEASGNQRAEPGPSLFQGVRGS